jgi:ribonucleotide reductase alpha subunit
VARYEEFLATGEDREPSWTRVLARYRTARLHRKLRQPEQALAAYRAVLAMEANDEYSGRLKGKAKTAIEELQAATRDEPRNPEGDKE